MKKVKERKEKPIVQYTSDEKEMLLSELEHRDGTLISLNALVEYYGVEYIIVLGVLYKIFKNDLHGLETTNPIVSNALIDLILYTPIEDVPMFMDILPQIAKWRLRIG